MITWPVLRVAKRVLPASVRVAGRGYLAAVRMAPRGRAYVLVRGAAAPVAHRSAALARAAAKRDIRRYRASERFLKELRGTSLGEVIAHLATRKRRR